MGATEACSQQRNSCQEGGHREGWRKQDKQGLFQKVQETRKPCHILEGVDRNGKTRQSTILKSSESLEAKKESAQKAFLILDDLKK